MDDDERAEVDRLSSPAQLGVRAGVGADASADEVRSAALTGVERWRARANNPMTDRRTTEAAEIISRAYEEIYASVG